jgi:hypothetical protein
VRARASRVTAPVAARGQAYSLIQEMRSRRIVLGLYLDQVRSIAYGFGRTDVCFTYEVLRM